MTADPVVCGCFDVTEDQVRAFFASGDRSFDDFVDATGATTKCTACRIDLDLLLSAIRTGEKGRPIARATRPRPSGWGVQEHVDSGVLLNRDGVRTVLRVDNRPNPFNAASCEALTDFAWRLRLVDEAGRARAQLGGRLRIGDALTQDLSEIPGCPPSGWFWIWLHPERAGYFGAVRPQFVLKGSDWAAAVHTQPHALACRGKTVMLAPRNGRLDSAVSIINGSSRAPTSCTVSLSGEDASRTATVSVARNGAGVFDLDTLFPEPIAVPIVFVSVASSEPVRKHIIQRQPGGALSIEHFPDVK